MADYEDITRIRRVLRQLRSRLQALSTAATTAPSSAAVLLHKAIINHHDTPAAAKTCLPLKHTYKGRNATAAHHSATTTSQPATSIAHYESPVRKPVLALRDTFQDLMERVHLHCFPLLDDADRNSIPSTAHATRFCRGKAMQHRNVLAPVDALPSLAQLAAFTVGTMAIHGYDVADDQGWYEEIPLHFRSFVLLEHLAHLCLAHVGSMPHVLEGLIDACISSRCYHQGYEMLLHWVKAHPLPSSRDYRYAYDRATKLCKSAPFLSVDLPTILSPKQVSSRDFHDFQRGIPLQEAGPLLVCVLSTHTEPLLDVVSKTAQDRLNEQVHRVIAFAVDGNLQARYCIVKLCNRLVRMSSLAMSHVKPSPVIAETAISTSTLFSMLMYGIDAYVTNQLSSTLVQRPQVCTWVHVAAHIYTGHHAQGVLSCFANIYESISDLQHIAACLASDALGSRTAHTLAIEITQHAIDTITRLEDYDDTILVQLEELEDELALYKRRMRRGECWRYEPILDVMVKSTPRHVTPGPHHPHGSIRLPSKTPSKLCKAMNSESGSSSDEPLKNVKRVLYRSISGASTLAAQFDMDVDGDLNDVANRSDVSEDTERDFSGRNDSDHGLMDESCIERDRDGSIRNESDGNLIVAGDLDLEDRRGYGDEDSEAELADDEFDDVEDGDNDHENVENVTPSSPCRKLNQSGYSMVATSINTSFDRTLNQYRRRIALSSVDEQFSV
ncbi:hypothetical protein SeMB42_g06867 [Synchytrium endobioticum]|uniref:Uncharacterized protein n=1 Tax=Synchytrium endobioticum TaxID=286115 RepID=A0A507D691_9FUNG|nr:hypothetical protein SeMB42_g06867 [Synchytrium endobioticum]TPX46946.1 hypothetical protein SeLEV6574_g02927 [Synchytrium endobioticum]